jgi:hypothetical protein
MPHARKIWPRSYMTRTLLIRMRFSIKMQGKWLRGDLRFLSNMGVRNIWDSLE